MNNNNTHQKSYPLQAQQNIMNNNNNNNNNNKGKRIRKSQNNEGIIMNNNNKNNNKRASKNKEALKVVYISTPMKVTASASKFREIVQELTGRESDVVSIMETYGGNDTWMVPDDDHHHHNNNKPSSLDHHHHDGSSPSSSSEDLVDHGNDNDVGGVFLKGQDCNFGIFDHSSSLFYDHLFQQFDLLGSY